MDRVNGWTGLTGGRVDRVNGLTGGRAIGMFTSSLPSEIAHPGLTELVVAPTLAERKRILQSGRTPEELLGRLAGNLPPT